MKYYYHAFMSQVHTALFQYFDYAGDYQRCNHHLTEALIHHRKSLNFD